MTDARDEKTVQEILAKYGYATDCPKDGCECSDTRSADMIREVIKLTLDKQWIPVSEQLPECSTNILLGVESSGQVYPCRYMYNQFFKIRSRWPMRDVTSWQPLPSPPSREQQ